MAGDKAHVLGSPAAQPEPETYSSPNSGIGERANEVAARRAAQPDAPLPGAALTEAGSCGVCGGTPLVSGRKCICGGAGTEVAEMQGLREELLSWEIAAGHVLALPRESSDKFQYFAAPLPDGAQP